MKLGSKAQDNKYANVPGHRPRAEHTQRECKRVSIGFRRFRASVAAHGVCAFCTPKGIHFGVHVFLLLPNPLPFSRALCFPLPNPSETIEDRERNVFGTGFSTMAEQNKKQQAQLEEIDAIAVFVCAERHTGDIYPATKYMTVVKTYRRRFKKLACSSVCAR